MTKLRLFLRAARLHWTSTSALTALTALALAWEEGHFSASWAIGAWLMFVSLHSAILVWDELADYKVYRERMYRDAPQQLPTDFSAGSGVLTHRLLTFGEVSVLFALLLGTFAALAAYAVYTAGLELLLVMGFILFWGLGYGAPPFKWSYRGLGEIGLALVTGPALCMIVYFAAKRFADPAAPFSFPARFWLVSSIPGLMAFAQTFWGQLIDLEEDRAAGKRNLSVRWGTRATLSLQVGAIALCAAIVAGLAVGNAWLWPTLGVLLFALREALWVLRNRDDYEAVAARYRRHPLYRALALTCVGLTFGLVADGLARLDGSAAGAAWILGLTLLSISLGLRFYLPARAPSPDPERLRTAAGL